MKDILYLVAQLDLSDPDDVTKMRAELAELSEEELQSAIKNLYILHMEARYNFSRR